MGLEKRLSVKPNLLRRLWGRINSKIHVFDLSKPKISFPPQCTGAWQARGWGVQEQSEGRAERNPRYSQRWELREKRNQSLQTDFVFQQPVCFLFRFIFKTFQSNLIAKLEDLTSFNVLFMGLWIFFSSLLVPYLVRNQEESKRKFSTQVSLLKGDNFHSDI